MLVAYFNFVDGLLSKKVQFLWKIIYWHQLTIKMILNKMKELTVLGLRFDLKLQLLQL